MTIFRVLFATLLILAGTVGVAGAEELILECPPLTPLQEFAGMITLGNFLAVLGTIAGIVCAIALLLLIGFPEGFYKFLLWVLGIGGMLFGASIGDGFTPTLIALSGCLLFAVGLAWTFVDSLENSFQESMLLFVLFVVWSVVAVMNDSSLIGFIAMLALFGTVAAFDGFGVLAYSIGMEGDKITGRGTIAGLALVSFYLMLYVGKWDLLPAELFKGGALYVGAFAAKMSLLVASTKWQSAGFRRFFLQFVFISMCLLSIVIGAQLDVAVLMKSGGTFLVLYLLEKAVEMLFLMTSPWLIFTIGLILSSLVVWAGYAIIEHAELFNSYLFFI